MTESISSKPKLAIVCNYDDNSCGIAAYTRLRERSFESHFNVTVFDLKSATLMRRPEKAAAAKEHIEAICRELPVFDLVCLDLEFGIWGESLDIIEERLLACAEVSRQLVLTIHSVHTDPIKSGPFVYAQDKILLALGGRGPAHPFHIIVHSQEEAEILRSTHGFSCVSCHPLSFITAEYKSRLLSLSDVSTWKSDLGLDPEDIVVGVFGALSKYKDNRTVVAALRLLPERYKVLFVGGAHPFSLRPFKADENVLGILDAISEAALKTPGLESRVRFSGVLDDENFRQTMQRCDVVVVPYHDAGQRASGVTSMAFELGKRIITTHNLLFLNYRRLYGDCFEMYDIGNYIELRDRVMFFDRAKASKAFEERDLYTPETMAAVVADIYARLVRGDAPPPADLGRLAAHVSAVKVDTAEAAARIDPEGAARDLAHAREAFTDAIKVQEILKQEKQNSEAEFARAQESFKLEKQHSEDSVSKARDDFAKLKQQLWDLRSRIEPVLEPPMRLPSPLRWASKPVTPYNTILDDAARARYSTSVMTLWLLAPEMMARKIPRANVQQAFVLSTVEALVERDRRARLLCVGSFEDTAAAALEALGYPVDGIDPTINVDLATYRLERPELHGSYDAVFSTSVFEDVPDDEGFLQDIVTMLKPGGHAVITCDFDNRWTPGKPKPSRNVKLFTKTDLNRVVAAAGNVRLVGKSDWDRDKLDFTLHEPDRDVTYSFATLVLQKFAGPN